MRHGEECHSDYQLICSYTCENLRSIISQKKKVSKRLKVL